MIELFLLLLGAWIVWGVYIASQSTMEVEGDPPFPIMMGAVVLFILVAPAVKIRLLWRIWTSK